MKTQPKKGLSLYMFIQHRHNWEKSREPGGVYEK